jgi:hypothetical protein
MAFLSEWAVHSHLKNRKKELRRYQLAQEICGGRKPVDLGNSEKPE